MVRLELSRVNIINPSQEIDGGLFNNAWIWKYYWTLLNVYTYSLGIIMHKANTNS